MKKVRNKVLMSLGVIVLMISGLYIFLDKVKVTDKDLAVMILKQYNKSVDYQDFPLGDVIFLGSYTIEVIDQGLWYHIHHLGVIPITYRESISLLNKIKNKELARIKELEEAQERQLLNKLKE
jgi:hypothetical protein